MSLLLLSASVVLGVLTSIGWRSDRWPRFLTSGLHRNLTLLALAFLVLHIVTTVADAFAPIGLRDAVIPFLASYRPFWLGLGTLAFDLVVALILTSLLRTHIGYRSWRALHWLAYASWPLALVHGLGTGSDARASWMLYLSTGCAVAVVGAVLWRLAQAREGRQRLRIAAGFATIALPVLILGWYVTGPRRPGWAARAGTPPSLLATSLSPLPDAAPSGRGPSPGPALLSIPFAATLRGTSRSSGSDGRVTVHVSAAVSGRPGGVLRMTIWGAALSNAGGVAMSGSRATFGPTEDPGAFTGRIVALHGSRMIVTLSSRSGRSFNVLVDLHISDQTGSVRGVMHRERSSLSSGEVGSA